MFVLGSKGFGHGAYIMESKEAYNISTGGKRAMKRFKLLFLFLSLLVSQVVMGITPDGWVDQKNLMLGGVRYTLDGDKATVQSVEADVPETLVLPGTIHVAYGAAGQAYTTGDFPVTKIANGAFAGAKVTTLAFGEGVEMLDSEAFRGAVELKKVYFLGHRPPEGLKGSILPSGVSVLVAPGSEEAYRQALSGHTVFPFSAGLLLVSTPTGHGQVVALLDGRPIPNIYEYSGKLGALRLVARADSRYTHGAWKLNGKEVEGKRISKEQSAPVEYYDSTGLSGLSVLEISFAPRRALVSCAVLPSDSWTLNAENALIHEAGGTIEAPAELSNNGGEVPNGKVLEFKAHVDRTVEAELADGTRKPIWAVAEWRVNGRVVRDANGAVLTSAVYRHIVDGPAQVAVKFKRTYYKLVAKYHGYEAQPGESPTYLWASDTVTAGAGWTELEEGVPIWRKAGLETYVDVYGYAMASTLNGYWYMPSQRMDVVEDMYFELWRMWWQEGPNGGVETYGVPSVAMLVSGPGKLRVQAINPDGSEQELKNGDSYTEDATLRASVEYDKKQVRLVTFSLWDMDLPAGGYKEQEARGTKKYEAVFAPKGSQVLMLTNQGGVALKVSRDGKQLRTGDLLYRGDQLKISAYRYGNNAFQNQSYELVSLRVNGTEFQDNDVYTVGSEDVHVVAGVANFQAQDDVVPILDVKVTGEGTVDLEQKVIRRNANGEPLDKNGQPTNDKSRYAYDYYMTYSSWSVYPGDWVKVTPHAASGYMLKKLSCNGVDIIGSYNDDKKWWNVVPAVTAGHVRYAIEAVFVKQKAISLFTEVEGPGYIRVDDLTSGRSLREGDELTVGHLLRITAESTNPNYYARAITVNGLFFTSGDTYVVRGGGEDVSITAHIDSVQNREKVVLYKSITGRGTLSVYKLPKKTDTLQSGEELAPGELLWYEAKPATGYTLSRVSFGDRLTNNMSWDLWKVDSTPKELVVEANFIPNNKKLLTIYTAGHGLLEVYNEDGEKLRRGDALNVGEKLTFRVQPDVGNRLVSFTVNGLPQLDGEAYVVRDQDQEVKVDVTFAELKEPVLVYQISGRGGIVVAWPGATDRDSYANGIPRSQLVDKDWIVVRLQPDKASQVKYLTINGKLRQMPTNVNKEFPIKDLQGDIVINAAFVPKGKSGWIQLAVYSTPGGEVEVEGPDGRKYHSGDAIGYQIPRNFTGYKITAKPKEGYALESLKLDGQKFNSGQAVASAPGINIYADQHDIAAVFKPLKKKFKAVFVGEQISSGRLYVKVNAGLQNEDEKELKEGSNVLNIPYGTRLSCSYAVEGQGVVAHAMIRVNRPETKSGLFMRPGEVFTMPSEDVEVACIVSGQHSVPLLFGYRGTGKGEVTVTDASGNSLKNGKILQRGDRIRVDCKANSGSRFLSLTVNGHALKSLPADYEVGDEARVQIEAVFAKDEGEEFGLLTYRIEGEPDAASLLVRNGRRVCLDGVRVRRHDELTVEVDLKDHNKYRLVSLRVNGQPLQNGKSYFANGDVEVVATVAKRVDQVLMLTETGMGEVQVYRNAGRIFGGAKLYPGDLLRLRVKPVPGFRLVSLQVNGMEVPDGYEYTVGRGDVTIVGVFAGVDQTVLSLLSNAGGRIVVMRERDNARLNSGAPIAKGDKLRISGVAQSGYELVLLQVAGSRFESGEEYTIPDDGKDLLVKAYFAPVGTQELVILVKGPAGTVEVKAQGSDAYYADGSFLSEGTPLSIVTQAPSGISCKSLTVNGDASPFSRQGLQMAGAYTVKKGEHVVLEAEFVGDAYELRWEIVGGGSATVSLRGATLSQPATLSYGDEVTIKPEARSGYAFYGVFDDEGHKLTGLSYRMGERKTVKLRIVFVPADSYVVSWETQPTQGGTLVLLAADGSPLPNAQGSTVQKGAKLTATAGAASGYQFYSLEQNGKPMVNGGVHEVTEKMTHFVARFIEEDKTVVHVKISQGGTALLSVYGVGTEVHDGSLVETGNAIIVNAKPDAGYELESIFVDGAKIANGETFQAHGTDVYVDIKFRTPLPAGKYRLTTNVTGKGTIAVADKNGNKYLDGAVLEPGAELTITAQPAPGYKTVSFTVNGKEFKSGKTTHKVESDVLVQAKYEVPKQYHLLAHVVDTDGQDITGAVVTATSTTGTGRQYTLRGANGKYSVVLPPDTYEVKAAKDGQSRTLQVEVKDADLEVTLRLGVAGAKKYTLSLDPADGQVVVRTGNGVVADRGTLYEGDKLTFEVKPQGSNRFVKMAVNGAAHEPDQPWTVDGDVHVKAYFAKDGDYLLFVTLEGDELGSVKVEKAGSTIQTGATLKRGEVLTVTTAVKEPQTNMRSEFSVKGAEATSGDEYKVVEDVYVSAKFAARPTYPVTIEVVDVQGNPITGFTSTHALAGGKLPDGTLYSSISSFASGDKLPEGQYTLVTKPGDPSYREAQTLFVVRGGACTVKVKLAKDVFKLTVKVVRKGQAISADKVTVNDQDLSAGTPVGEYTKDLLPGVYKLFVQAGSDEQTRMVEMKEEAQTITVEFPENALPATDYFMLTDATKQGGKLQFWVSSRASGYRVPSGAKVAKATKIEIADVPDADKELYAVIVNGQSLPKEQRSGYAVEQNTVAEGIFGDKLVGSDKVRFSMSCTSGGTLTVTDQDDGNRALKQADQVKKYHKLMLEAIPDQAHGYALKELKVNGRMVDNHSVIVAKEDVVVTAVFGSATQSYLTITYSGTGTGTLTVHDGPDALSSGVYVEAGHSLTFKSAPDPDNVLSQMYINGVPWDVDLPWVVKRGEDVAIEVFFDKGNTPVFRFTQEVRGNGTLVVTKDGQPLENKQVISVGETLLVQATPASSDWELVRLLRNGREDLSNGAEVKVAGSEHIAAIFGQRTPADHIYDVTIAYQGTGKGLLHVTVDGQEYTRDFRVKDGSHLTFVAKPNSGSQFLKLLVNGRELDPSAGFTVVGEAVNLTAVFIADSQTQTLTYSAVSHAGSTISVAKGTQPLASGSAVADGDTLTVTSHAQGGESLLALQANGRDILSSREYTVQGNENVHIVGIFGRPGDLYLLSVVIDGQGTLGATVNGRKEPLPAQVKTGDKIKFRAKPATGWELFQLYINNEPWNLSDEYVVGTQQVEVRAKFVSAGTKHILNVTTHGAGTVTVKSAGTPVASGDELHKGDIIDVKAKPAAGLVLKQLEIAGVECTSYKVTDNSPKVVEVSAYFAPKTEQHLFISYLPEQGMGTVSVTCDGKAVGNNALIAAGQELRFEQQPAAGNQFVELLVDGAEHNVAQRYTVPAEGDVKVVGVYKKDVAGKYTLVASKQGEGTLKVGTHEVGSTPLVLASQTAGTKYKVEATAGANQELKRLLVNGRDFASGSEVEVKDADVRIYALFGPTGTPVLSVGYEGRGLIEVLNAQGQVLSSGTKLQHGELLTFKATETDSEYKFFSMQINGRAFDVNGTYEVGKSDVRVTAIFIKKSQKLTLTYAAIPTEGGKVNVTRSGQVLENGAGLSEGEVLTVALEPATTEYAPGKIFVNGRIRFDTKGNSANEYTYTVKDSSINVVGIFRKSNDAWLLSIRTVGEGEIHAYKVEGSSEYRLYPQDPLQAGDHVRFKAVPGAKTRFAALEINGVDHDINALYEMPRTDIEVVAYFEPFNATDFLYRQQVKGQGTLTVTNGSLTLQSGDRVKKSDLLIVKAKPEAGYKLIFLDAEGADLDYSGQDTTMAVGDRNILLKAVFANADERWLIDDTKQGGQVKVYDVSKHPVARVYPNTLLDAAVEKLRFEPLPNDGMELTALLVNKVLHDPTVEYTLPSAGAVHYEGHFRKAGQNDQKTLLILQDGEGTLLVKNGQNVLKHGDHVSNGNMLTLDATPASGYRLRLLTAGGEKVRNGGLARVQGLEATYTVYALFEQENDPQQLLTLTYAGDYAGSKVEVSNNGASVPTAVSRIKGGDKLEFLSKPATDKQLAQLLLNGKVQSVVNDKASYVVNGTESVDAVAIFNAKGSSTNVLYAEAVGAGILEVYDGGNKRLFNGSVITKGQQLLVYTNPDFGYKLTKLVINQNPVSDVTPEYHYTVAEDAPLVIYAYFEQIDKYSVAATVRSEETKATLRSKWQIAKFKGSAWINCQMDPDTISGTGQERMLLDKNQRYKVTVTPIGYAYSRSAVIEKLTKNEDLLFKFGKETELKTYDLSIESSEHGTVSVFVEGNLLPEGKGVLVEGDKLEFRVTPNAGYKLAALLINDLPLVDYKLGYQVERENVVVKPVFVPASQQHTLIISSQPTDQVDRITVQLAGTTLKSGSKLDVGQQLTVNVDNTAADLQVLTVNGARFESGTSYTVRKQDEVVTVFASFSNEKQYWLTVNYPNSGKSNDLLSVYRNGSAVALPVPSRLQEGDALTFQARPADGRRLLQMNVNDLPFRVDNEWHVGKESVSVDAIFAPNDKAYMTISQVGEGTLDVTKDGNNLTDRPIELKEEGNYVFTLRWTTPTALKSFVINGVEYKDKITPASNNTYTFEYTQGMGDVQVVVVFDSPTSRWLLVSKSSETDGDGEVVTRNADGKCVQTPRRIQEAEVYSFEARPAFGSFTVGMQIDGTDYPDKVTYQVPASGGDVLVTGFFALDRTHTDKAILWVSKVGKGDVVVKNKDGIVVANHGDVKHGATYSFTATPASTYLKKLVTVDGRDYTDSSSFKVPTNTQVIRLSAVFGLENESNIYVTYAGTGHGVVNVSRETKDPTGLLQHTPVQVPGVVQPGDLLTFEPVADQSSKLVQLFINGKPYVQGYKHTVLGGEDVRIEAIFDDPTISKGDYVLSYSTSGKGKLSVTREGKALKSGDLIKPDQVLTVAATPEAPNTRALVQVLGAAYNANEVTVGKENVTIQATFTSDDTRYVVYRNIGPVPGEILVAVNGTMALLPHVVKAHDKLTFSKPANDQIRLVTLSVNDSVVDPVKPLYDVKEGEGDVLLKGYFVSSTSRSLLVLRMHGKPGTIAVNLTSGAGSGIPIEAYQELSGMRGMKLEFKPAPIDNCNHVCSELLVNGEQKSIDGAILELTESVLNNDVVVDVTFGSAPRFTPEFDIKDVQTKKAVDGATVTLANRKCNLEKEWKDYKSGNPVDIKVTEGMYSLIVSAPGYETYHELVSMNKANHLIRVELAPTGNNTGNPVEPAVLAEVSLYPNPVANKLTVRHVNEVEQLVVYTVLGEELLRLQPSGQDEILIPVETFPEGTYVLQAESKGAKRLLPFVVAR